MALLHSLACPALQLQYMGPELGFSPQIYLCSSEEMSRLDLGELGYLQAGTGCPYEPEAGNTGRKLLALPPPRSGVNNGTFYLAIISQWQISPRLSV